LTGQLLQLADILARPALTGVPRVFRHMTLFCSSC
jgi:hypothetical protein